MYYNNKLTNANIILHGLCILAMTVLAKHGGCRFDFVSKACLYFKYVETS